MGKFIDETGNIYGKLTVLERAENGKYGSARWLCRCQCGAQKVVAGDDLRHGKTKSCGCYNRQRTTTHGLSYHYLYRTWARIKERCYNPNHKSYKNYGGRGIYLEPIWYAQPEVFIEWVETNLGERPEGCSIDRVDNDWGYFIGNLKWSTRKEQANNRRNWIISQKLLNHDLTRGEKNGQHKLTEAQVLEIKELCSQGELEQNQIAALFGVCRATVSMIKNEHIWRHLWIGK